jgi:hypothetical protein
MTETPAERRPHHRDEAEPEVEGHDLKLGPEAASEAERRPHHMNEDEGADGEERRPNH